MRFSCDHAGTNVRAADIDGQDAVVRLEDPSRAQVGRAPIRPGVVGMIVDWQEIDVDAVSLEQDICARNGQFPDCAVPAARRP